MSDKKDVSLGNAIRIYKNSLGKVLAIDTIYPWTRVQRQPVRGNDYNLVTVEWFYSSYITSKRTTFHLGEGDRIVASILMIGNYIDITVDAGDYLTVTWTATDGDESDPVLDLSILARIGDTL